MFDELIEAARAAGSDPYKVLAGFVLEKDAKNVSIHERYRFKQAFYACFHIRGPDIIKNCLDDLRELDKLPAVREHLQEKVRRT